MPQSQITLEFLQKLKDSGHWNDDYDYSEVEYIKTKEKIKVIDNKFNSRHFIFPNLLLKGTKCTISNAVDKTKYAVKQFNNMHGDEYDYSKFRFILGHLSAF